MTRIRPSNQILFEHVKSKLLEYDQNVRPIPGIGSIDSLECLSNQIIDSYRRIKYVQFVAENNFDPSVADSLQNSFDPIKAASWYLRNDEHDEACWLVFLSTVCGKHRQSGWELVRHIHNGLGQGITWSWHEASMNGSALSNWLVDNADELKARGSFSNHRRYESFRENQTPRAIETYIDWVGQNKCHRDLITEAPDIVIGNPSALFSHLYRSLHSVHRLGRLGKFDYLTMLGKVGCFDIQPDSTYAATATGPLNGGRLLFDDHSTPPRNIQTWLDELARHLDIVHYPMQVVEDAICNWQKNPTVYRHFIG